MSRSRITMLFWLGLLIGIFALVQGLPAAEVIEEKVYGEPREDQALVYLIRERHFAGSARTMFVYADEQLLGVLDNGSYTFAYVDPGTRLLWANWTRIRKEVDLIPHRTYYIEAWGEFEFLEPAEGQALVAKVKSYVVPKPKELRAAEKHIRKRYGKALRREEEMGKAEIATVGAAEKPIDTTGYLRVPAYTEFTLELMENVTSYMNPTGSQVWLRTSSDVSVDGELAIPEGTLVQGTVRHAAKGAEGGIGGNFDLVIPSAVAIDDSVVPLLGRIDSTGRRKSGAAAAAAAGTAIASTIATGGLLTLVAAFPRGKEAFLLVGEEFTVWTKSDHWVQITPIDSPRSPAGIEPSVDEMPLVADVVAPIVFAPEKRRVPPDLEVVVESDVPVQDATIREIDGWGIPAPVRALGVLLREEKWIVTFGGWSLVRYARLAGEQTNVAATIRVVLVDGSSFSARVVIPIRLKAKWIN